MDYASLLSAVEGMMNRGSLSGTFPLFVALAETDINNRLALSPVRPQHTQASLAVDAEYIDAPANVMDVVAMASEHGPVTYVDPANMDLLGPVCGETYPRNYTKIGEKFRFHPVPTATFTVSLTYWANVPALTTQATSNWVLSAHLPVYWHGILAHGNQYYEDGEKAATHAGLFDVSLDQMLARYPAATDTASLRAEPGLTPSRLWNQ